MSDFENYLLQKREMPLADAAAFFLKIKTADENNIGSSMYEAPDTTGQLEGKFAVGPEQVLAQMSKMVQNEFKTNYAYTVYANSLRGLAHHSIADEFEDHAVNETEHVDFLLRRMAVLGGPVHVPDIPAPPASTDPVDIINIMIRMEQEGIQNWRVLRQMVGDDNPMRFKIEEYLTVEQEHLDELWQMVPHTDSPQLLSQKAGVPIPPAGEEEIEQKTADDKSQVETGRQRAIANLSSNFTNEAHTRGESVGDLVGRIAGGIVGGAGGSRLAGNGGDLVQVAGVLGGIALGQHLGGRAGKAIGKESDREMFKKKFAEALESMGGKRSFTPEEQRGIQMGRMKALSDADKRLRAESKREAQKTAAAHIEKYLDGTLEYHGQAMKLALQSGVGRGSVVVPEVGLDGVLKLASERMKIALNEMSEGGQNIGPSMPAINPAQPGAPDPQIADTTMTSGVQEYMQREQQGIAAEREAQESYYREKFQAASKALEDANQQAQQAQQQVQQLQQQVDQSGQQQQAAMDQAKQVQNAALQNAQAAHQAATQAMQQALSAQNDSMAQAQLAVQMRDSVHAMRQSMMQLIQQQMPPATTAEASAMAVDQNPAAQEQAAQQATAQEGGGNPAAQDSSQQPGAEAPPANQAGTPGAGGAEGGAPANAASPGANGPEGSTAPVDPNQPMMQDASQQGQVGMAQGAPKQASAWSVFANPKGVTPGVRSSAFGEKWAESIGEQMADARARRALKASFKVKKTGGEDERDPIKEAFDRSALIGGALGALTAGGATALESRMPVNDLLRSHIAEKEKDYTQNKSFSKAMSIAQQKAMLAASDVVHNHPVASTALAALSGFGTGAALGPQVMKTLQLRKGA